MFLVVGRIFSDSLLSLESSNRSRESFWRNYSISAKKLMDNQNILRWIKQHRIRTVSFARNLWLAVIFQFLRHFIDPRQTNHFFESVGPPTNCIFLDIYFIIRNSHIDFSNIKVSSSIETSFMFVILHTIISPSDFKNCNFWAHISMTCHILSCHSFHFKNISSFT